MKRMLALLGSPRENGNTAALARAVAEGAAERGYEASFVQLARLSIKGCIDCRRCWEKGRPCVIKDDMDTVYDSLASSDAVIFATPLYWYSWSGQIKLLWDRLLPFGSPKAEKSLAGKKAILVASAGEEDLSAFDGLLFSYDKSCSFLDLQQVGRVLATGVYEAGEICKGEWLSEAKDLGRRFT